jgi:hypothetical protein
MPHAKDAKDAKDNETLDFSTTLGSFPRMNISTGELLDYTIGSPTAGVVEPGLTQRIAEDYGLVLP